MLDVISGPNPLIINIKSVNRYDKNLLAARNDKHELNKFKQSSQTYNSMPHLCISQRQQCKSRLTHRGGPVPEGTFTTSYFPSGKHLQAVATERFQCSGNYATSYIILIHRCTTSKCQPSIYLVVALFHLRNSSSWAFSG